MDFHRRLVTKLRSAAEAALRFTRRPARRRLLDVSGRPIGTVRNLLRDPGDRILLMEVAASGPLGLRRLRLLVPGELIRGVTDQSIQVALSRDRLRDAPALRPRRPGPCLDEVYSYYGCARPAVLRVLPGSGYVR
jgi:hypothetical protein